MLNNFTKQLLVSILTMIIGLGCSKKNSTREFVPHKKIENEGVGPFNVMFDPTTHRYEHRLNLEINQDEGKVEYYLTTTESANIVLVNSSLSAQRIR